MKVPIDSLKVDPDLLALVPRPSAAERDLLKKGIAEDGQKVPVLVTPGLTLLDGHTRLDVMRELGIHDVRVEVTDDGLTRAQVKLLAIKLNVSRRHLTDFQRGELGMALLAVEQERARERMAEAKRKEGVDARPPLQPEEAGGKTRDVIAQQVGLKSGRQFDRIRTVIERGTEQDREDLRAGRKAVNEVHNRISRDERKVAAEAKAATIAPEDLAGEVICGDGFAELAHLHGKVDLVITDLPYGIGGGDGTVKRGKDIVCADEGMPEWDRVDARDVLLRAVEKVGSLLRPGGSFYLFTDRLLAGDGWEVSKAHGLTPRSLVYWRKTNVPPHGRKCWASAIEVVLYGVKPGAPYTWNLSGDVDNVIEAPICGGAERSDHPTQKPVSVYARLIDASSNPGDQVVDFMAGSGTCGEACRDMGRRFALVERDPAYVNIIKSRLAALAPV